jgi:predicted nuclease of predicted toxin-antitoxin system
VKFLLDDNLSPLHARTLRALRHDAVSVVELGLSGAADLVVRAAAIEAGRVLLTLDADFGNVLRYPPAAIRGVILTEEVRFKDGEVLDRNFDSYEIPRFSWLPKIETVLIENPEVPAPGCGEPPIVTMGAVVANAIHDAVGARLLQLPMTPARIQEALGRG